MVSMGDTEISLHIRSPRFRAYGGGGYSGVRTENTQSAKICLNFNLGGEEGGYSGVRTENTQSAKICLNVNWGGGGTLESNTQSAKICLNFNLGGGGPLWSEIPERGSL